MTKALPVAAAVLFLAAAATLPACATARFDGPDGDRLFYEARCGVCHAPWPRSSHEPGAWPEIVDEMAPRAGLSAAQRARVLAYLTAR